MTGEHVWSDWLNREEAKGYTFRRKTSGEVVLKEWKSQSINLRVRLVCKDCNSTWMSDLEAAMEQSLGRAIRHAEPVSLDAERILSIARFAFAKSVVADHMRARGKPFFSPSARQRFSVNQRIPDGVEIWIAGFKSREHLSRGIFKSVYNKISVLNLNLYVFTYGAGYLVLQLVALKPVRVPGYVSVLRQNIVWNEAVAKLWPTDGRLIDWPFRKYLSDDTINGFCDRWSKLEFESL